MIKKNKQQGITLIEVLVYLGLFAVLMSGIITATYTLLQGSRSNENAVAIQEEGTFLMRKINWELTGAASVSTIGANTLIVTNDFQTKLAKLPVASLLRIVVAEKWSVIIEHHRLGFTLQTVFKVGPYNRCCPFGSEG